MRGLAQCYARSGRSDHAYPHLSRALELFETAGDRINQASIHLRLAWLDEQHGRPAEGLSHAEQARDLFHIAGYRAADGWVLTHIASCHARLGNHQQAIACYQQVLRKMTQDVEATYSEAGACDGLGHAHHSLANHEQAIAFYQRAINLYRQMGDRAFEAPVLTRLADTYHAAGDLDAARQAWQHALNILDELHHPDADEIRAKLQTPTHS